MLIRMTWWQTLLVAVVPVLVTAVSLVTQSVLTARREDGRQLREAADRNSERAHAAAEAKKERDHQLQVLQDTNSLEVDRADETAKQTYNAAMREYWRDERRRAHFALLAELQTAIAALNRANITVKTRDGKLEGQDVVVVLEDETRKRITNLGSEVEMIGSEVSRKTGAELVQSVLDLDLRFWVETVLSRVSERPDPQFGSTLLEVDGLRRKYVDTIRTDLGTTN